MSVVPATELTRDYLRGFANLYPSIDAWSATVFGQIPQGRRSVLAYLLEGVIAGLAITKNGPKAKLCHISVSTDSRLAGLGGSLMQAAVAEMLAHRAQQIHVTTSEEVESAYGDFFARSGFVLKTARPNRYRQGYNELEWGASAERLSAVVAVKGWTGTSHTSQRIRPVLMRLACTGQTSLAWTPYERAVFF